MPYNNEQFGDITKALTKSLYVMDYATGMPSPPPPSDVYLVDEVSNFIIDESSNFIIGVL